MDFHDFAMDLLNGKDGAGPSALMYSDSFIALATADAAKPITGTAIVNLLQSSVGAGLGVSRVWIYANYEPTEACKGMARLMTRGGLIFFRQGGVMKCWEAARTNAGFVALRWNYSPKPTIWQWFAPRGSDASSRISAIGKNTHGRHRNGSVAELAVWLKKDVDDFKKLVATTGRGREPATQFADPKNGGIFEIVRHLKTDKDRDDFFSLLAQELVFRLTGRVPNIGADQKAGHNIGSLLVNKSWQVVGWAVNTNRQNGTFHGETNLVQAFEGYGNRELPAGGTLYTSLEPCEMCSGVIRKAVAPADKKFRVVYIQKDATLSDTALRAADSPIGLSKSAAVSEADVSGLRKNAVFGDELSRIQSQLARTNKQFLAPTMFLKQSAATDVFKAAQDQRQRLSGSVAGSAAFSHSRSLATRVADSQVAGFQPVDRQQITASLMRGRTEAEIGVARDDMALLQPRSAKAQLALAQQELLKKQHMTRVDLLRRGTQDDMALELMKKQLGDPFLMDLARKLDSVSERFKRAFNGWMQAHGSVRTTAEKARMLGQVSDFLDQAIAGFRRSE